MKVVVSGGGTGGHIYPALAIASQLKTEGADILYMGARNSLEAKLAEKNGFAFSGIDACGLHKKSPRLLADLAVNYAGLRQSLAIIRREKPGLVIGTGGYAEAPVVKAAQQLRIPTLLHEQNAFPGLANRFLANKADAVCLTFAAAGKYFRHQQCLHLTGMPIRGEILAASRDAAWEYFNIPDERRSKPTLLITGGSQGADSLNSAALAAVPVLLKAGFNIIHICGENNYFELKQRHAPQPQLILLPYLERMEHALAMADLAVARAGASFLAEAAACALPAILVPYPYAANDHQRKNAAMFAEAGAAVVVEDAMLEGLELAGLALSLTAEEALLSRMSQAAGSLASFNAAEKICEIAKSLIRN